MTEAETRAFLHRYLKAVEEGATGDALAAFYRPEAIFTEHPNALSKNGSRRDLAAILAGAAAGQNILSAQRYDVKSIIVSGDQAAAKVRWEGDLKIDFPSAGLKAGATLRADFAQFYTLRDGAIATQETFDCYEPW